MYEHRVQIYVECMHACMSLLELYVCMYVCMYDEPKGVAWKDACVFRTGYSSSLITQESSSAATSSHQTHDVFIENFEN